MQLILRTIKESKDTSRGTPNSGFWTTSMYCVGVLQYYNLLSLIVLVLAASFLPSPSCRAIRIKSSQPAAALSRSTLFAKLSPELRCCACGGLTRRLFEPPCFVKAFVLWGIDGATTFGHIESELSLTQSRCVHRRAAAIIYAVCHRTGARHAK